MTTQMRLRIVGFLSLGLIFLLLVGGIMSLQVNSADMSNPRANFWRAVRHGIPAYSSTPAQGHTILIRNSGENWREIRGGLVVRIYPWIIAFTLVVLGLFYAIVGEEKMRKPRSGVKIERFTLSERLLHWSTAIVFIIMAVTGLSLLLGRFLLIPIIGHDAVSWFLMFSKVLHNYAGPLLLVGIILEFLLWFKMNIPRKIDLQWFKNMGGMLGSGGRGHTGRVNGGEKAWFWVMFAFGLGVGITGVLLDFPIWGQNRLVMQISHFIHASVAILFVSAALAHIYMGTIGVEGAFEAMWTGYVDTEWANEQHDLWYEEKMQEMEAKKI